MAIYVGKKSNALPLSSVNHISRNCVNVMESLNFYENVLGFIPIKRPGFFNFDGAWLFNYGIGVHLLESTEHDDTTRKENIDPRDDHISFQCEDIKLVEKKLQENGIKYIARRVEEGGILVDQLFFHDPDGFMIEVCDCEKLPVVPLVPLPTGQQRFPFCKRSTSMSKRTMDDVVVQLQAAGQRAEEFAC